MRGPLQYSLDKHEPIIGSREKGWEELTVASLDSALNSWFDSVPDHCGSTLDGRPRYSLISRVSVRWDPRRENQTFFVQSSALHVAYYFIQITIHRPFIPTFRKESSLSFPAFAICASAARASSHVADALRKRYPRSTTPNIIVRALSPSHAYAEATILGQLPTFVTGVILLLSLWGAKRNGTSSDPAREIQDLCKCAKLLDMAESRWTVAGRLRCVLPRMVSTNQ